MNSESGQKLSLEELKQRNAQEPTPDAHPTQEEWSELLTILSALYRLTAAQHDLTEALLRNLRSSPVPAQTEEILRELRTLREAAQQAGRPNGNFFSRVGHRLPRPDWPTVFALLLAAAALLLLWWGLGAGWSSFSLPCL